MFKWLRTKLGITHLQEENELLCKKLFLLEGQLKCCESNITSSERIVARKLTELKEYTRVDADVGIRGNNTIILTGVMNGKGYVKFWDLGKGEFKAMAQQLKDMQRSSLIRHIDEPYNCDFRGMFDIDK